MFVLALVMFGITAIGGLTAAVKHLSHQPPPAWLGRVHGTLALASIIVTAVAVGRFAAADWKQAMYASAAVATFFIAAVLGRVLFSFHVRTGNVPRGLIAMHALAAVTGVLLLVAQILADGS